MNKKDKRSISLLDDVPVMVWMTNRHGACTFLNHRWYEFTGQKTDKGLDSGWMALIHPDDRPLVLKTFQTANERQESFSIEYRLQTKDGHFQWTIDSGAPRFGPQGEFAGFIGTVSNIHERKETEQQLRTSKDRYRHLVESIDEGFAVTEIVFNEQNEAVDLRWLEINSSFEKNTGLVQAAGKTAGDLIPDLDKSWFEIYGKVALTGETIRFENHAPALNRWFDVFAFRVDRPEQRRVAILFKDTTERKYRDLSTAFFTEIGTDFARASTSKEILTLAGKKLRRHLNVTGIAFAEIDESTNLATVIHSNQSPGIPRTRGIHHLSDYMTGDFFQELKSGRTIAVADVAADPRTRTIFQAYDKLMVRAIVKGAYIRDGRIKFLISVHNSVPRQWRASEIELIHQLSELVWLRLERARAEERLHESERDLRELTQSLETRVAKRTVKLQKQAVQLRNLAAQLTSVEQRERKRFAALLHDDLQQLLVAANMNLKSALRPPNGKDQRQMIAEAAKWIGEATDAARNLTRQLRPPALYEGGLVSALHGLAFEMEKRHSLKVTIHQGEEDTEVSDDLKALLFDSTRELLFNVAKYAGVSEATVRVSHLDGHLRVAVEDRGRGFNVEATAKSGSQSGFGLFSIRERLAAMEGEMDIISAPGKGTRITLEVNPLSIVNGHDAPENQISVEAISKRLSKPDAVDRRVRVLIVDDHAMVRQGLASMVDEDARLEVVAEASDGLEAIEAVRQHHPDVILIDVNMPRMNGIDASREIHRRWPKTIIIGLSVQDDSATAKAMLNAGASHFLSKAGESDRMIETMLELVEQVPLP